ncbi:hypothetical protein SGO_0627 [Streptococcus gordonii str. Challis substr. CH1]|uniref:Uncharacterized protein n=1 Tax=Streptococcus gordonii (strain Challis / ATCC 35105 / BCRC 15272 / CH1 / DL1 / V288) TaxID=467705 RepID=A8AVX0_STRGC|nr:hypothetical protein SGO_0627 [Streptococcus gordonii str. Challis substr. CH1]
MKHLAKRKDFTKIPYENYKNRKEKKTLPLGVGRQ